MFWARLSACLYVFMQGVGGEYRMDQEYLRLAAKRISEAQQVCFEEGMNMYVETHIGVSDRNCACM